MPANLKPLDKSKPSGNLSAVQRLELYQIIAFAEDGDSKKVIERAKQMLASAKESPVTFSGDHSALLRRFTVTELLEFADKATELSDI